MIDALLARAPTRFVFVVGKGGVGKTTTAGALALGLADRSAQTHLISTDPAHSVGDLFGQDLTHGKPAVSPCSESLVLEEFSARSYADRLFSQLRDPLIALIERGTYLDQTDAAGFLDLSVPGIDEVMSALRLADLHESACERIIVDTAPTGHTLRLLDAAGVIDSWVEAGRTMAEKAHVVATHLVGGSAPFAAEPLLDQLQRMARLFTDRVLRQSSAVAVMRGGGIVQSETERLSAELARRGVAVVAHVLVGHGGESKSESRFVIDLEPEPHGCAGLRDWASRVEAAADLVPAPQQAARAPESGAPAAAWIRAQTADLIMVAGKGGVGKSTCAAAIAVVLAESRRVCLVSTDPAGSLSQVLGVEIGASLVEVEPRLFARQVDASVEFQRMRDQYRSSVTEIFAAVGLEQAAWLDRRVIESFWDFAPPGIDEVIALVEILDRRGEFDTLIIDSAPTGHFLRLIELPGIVLDWVHALLRLLVKYGAVASLDALARDLLGFAKRLKELKLDLSTQGRSAVFVVTLAEPMVSAETARLSAALAHAGVPVAAAILNRAGGRLAGSAAGEREIRAPDLGQEIIGPAALRSFLAQWSINGE